MTTDAQKRATAKYDKANTTQLRMKLNNNTDADILQKLDSVDNKQGYIKSLVREDLNPEETYIVFFAHRLEKEIVFTGTKKECAMFEDILRKECRKVDPDGAELDCYTKSIPELQRIQANNDRWDSLTEEEKKDIIEVEGRRYVRKIWEANHK